MAVDGLDLSLDTGVHGLLARTAPGKPHSVRSIATVLRPASGTLTVLGETVNGRIDLRGLRHQDGYLPQELSASTGG